MLKIHIYDYTINDNVTKYFGNHDCFLQSWKHHAVFAVKLKKDISAQMSNENVPQENRLGADLSY